MKKLISVLCVMVLAVSMLTGCGVGATKDNGKISIVTTIFPEYDWVREITKGNANVEITMLLDKGVDLHSFQPTADDIVKVSSCDMFIYVGGESDEWVEDALAEATNKDMVVINLLDVLGDSVKEEELVEGMEGEEEEEESEEEGPEYDEHVWLSLKNAEVLCQYISDELCKIDPDNKETYETNVKAYISQLDTLDKEYEAAVSNASVKTVLFGDRFPFRYLVDDYGLDYYAAFVGCSAESEASFETIKFLADKTDELGLDAILQIESADGKMAQTIKDTTKTKSQQILTMDSMQSVTAKDVSAGATYLGIMQENLSVLSQAIN
ncbi:MAG: zinc ABC transporter substrate-binding protein [Lachnospiraceae bacterium]|nr:zinc ABC transporter substrate-binding protein [Candidatus Colinaster equi]